MVMIQNQLVGSAIGQKITLECQSEAYPKSINYWMKNESILTQGKEFLLKLSIRINWRLYDLTAQVNDLSHST